MFTDSYPTPCCLLLQIFHIVYNQKSLGVLLTHLVIIFQVIMRKIAQWHRQNVHSAPTTHCIHNLSVSNVNQDSTVPRKL